MKAVFGPQWLSPLSLSLGEEEGYIPPPQIKTQTSFLCLLGMQLSGLMMVRDSITYSQAVSLPASMTLHANPEKL